MRLNIFRKEVKEMNAIFNGHYIDIKAFYAWHFNKVPCVHFIDQIEVTKACAHINERYKYYIDSIYQHAWHDYDEGKMFFNNTIFVLNNYRMIELANDYCQLLFTPKQFTWSTEMMNEIIGFRKVAPKEVRIMGFARQPETN
ncbi:hypothetical protein BH11BAC3_BH11BAC3_44110 [soil metagenome]